MLSLALLQEAGKAAAPAPAVPDLATYCSQKNGTLVATKDECIFVFEEYVQDLGLTLLGPDSLTGFPTVFKEGYDTACSFGTPSQVGCQAIAILSFPESEHLCLARRGRPLPSTELQQSWVCLLAHRLWPALHTQARPAACYLLPGLLANMECLCCASGPYTSREMGCAAAQAAKSRSRQSPHPSPKPPPSLEEPPLQASPPGW